MSDKVSISRAKHETCSQEFVCRLFLRFLPNAFALVIIVSEIMFTTITITIIITITTLTILINIAIAIGSLLTKNT